MFRKRGGCWETQRPPKLLSWNLGRGQYIHILDVPSQERRARRLLYIRLYLFWDKGSALVPKRQVWGILQRSMELHAGEHELTHMKIFGVMVMLFFVRRRILKQEKLTIGEKEMFERLQIKYQTRLRVGQWQQAFKAGTTFSARARNFLTRLNIEIQGCSNDRIERDSPD